MMRARSPATGEDGYTLIELMVVVAMIAVLTTVGIESLSQHPAELNSAVQQFSLKLDEARGLALANGGRLISVNGTAAVADVGATLSVSQDPVDATYSVVTVNWFRPIRGSSVAGNIEPDTSTPALRLRAAIIATVPGDGTSRNFSIFLSPSGHLSVATDNVWKLNSGPLSSEPVCNANAPPGITFSSRGNSRVGQLVCDGAMLNMQ